jgi:hypothetical protein
MTNSPLSRHPSQTPEDWDHLESSSSMAEPSTSATSTSRVVFPSQGGAAAGAGAGAVADDPDTPTPEQSHRGRHADKRTLSELLKLHAEKGTDVHFSSEEANRLEELLGQWVRPVRLPFFFLSFFVSMMGLIDLNLFSGGLLCWVCRRSIRARRLTKGKMNFSHGRRMMTRSCSCTARLLSTLLLGIPHVVRVRVSLSDHNGRFFAFPL